MPNYCNNYMSIDGSEKDLEKFREAARGYAPGTKEEEKTPENLNELCFNNFVPMPQEAIDDYQNIGHSWSYDNWGTKWGAFDVNTDGQPKEGNINYTYTTAWGPCDKAIIAIIEQHPNLKFFCEYDECGMMFAGRMEGSDGEVTSDESQEFENEWDMNEFLDKDYTLQWCKECEDDWYPEDREEYINELCPECIKKKEDANHRNFVIEEKVA